MRTSPGRKFWLEATCGSISLALAVATLVSRTWIERLTGLDPDAGSGALELGITVALLTATVAFGMLAGHQMRIARKAGT